MSERVTVDWTLERESDGLRLEIAERVEVQPDPSVFAAMLECPQGTPPGEYSFEAVMGCWVVIRGRMRVTAEPEACGFIIQRMTIG